MLTKICPGMSIYRFFFSSRRRHTRSKRDWSSDVCSSDLPYKKVKSSDRYQTRLNRGEIIILGLRALNDAGKQKDKDGFSKLEGKEQDKILSDFEKGKGKITGLSSDMFFELLRQMTIEGCYCDPLYGGNRDMAGWKMREFPGAHPAYINDIDSKEFVKMDPISLEDY